MKQLTRAYIFAPLVSSVVVGMVVSLMLTNDLSLDWFLSGKYFGAIGIISLYAAILIYPATLVLGKIFEKYFIKRRWLSWYHLLPIGCAGGVITFIMYFGWDNYLNIKDGLGMLFFILQPMVIGMVATTSFWLIGVRGNKEIRVQQGEVTA